MNDLLSLRNISAGYGGKTIVKDVSLDIPAGEFCAILGLNGSGKTTLIKAISGLLPISTGSCFVCDDDCTKLSEYKRARYMSYIPQRHSKLIGVNVEDAVLMGLNPKLRFFEFPTAQDKELVDNALRKLDIRELKNEVFSELSEGQKQLVILARVLVQNAAVLLMDEPDAALDFNNRHSMLAKIRTLIKSEKKAGLVALHDPNLALSYCDRILLFADGEIVDDINITKVTAQKIRECLETVYKGIAVYEINGTYICKK